jgi:methyltransferase (TIGR00027 family)
MRAGRPSKTAMMVAFWRSLADRGLTTVPGFSDPAARELLDGPFWAFMSARVERLARQASGDRTKGFVPWIDSLVLRVAFIDSEIAKMKPRQVVILGAGLDTRAWRLEALRGARVFEVDHPATQTYKRDRAPRLGPPIAAVEYVAIDFVRDHLETRLRAAGFDATLPTAWVWEGVIMYLDDTALRKTLASIRALFVPGSRLIAHYHEPESTKRGNAWRLLLFSWLREPQIGLRTARTMASEITRAGFTLLEDAGLGEQAVRVGTTAPANAPLRVSRIAVAV